MWLFAGAKPLTCFYCLTASNRPGNPNPYYWKCPACEQWNRRNTMGEIVPDPGAKNVFMNHASWQRRASLPDNAFPPGVPWSPFCTQCVTNQKLIVEMVANYVPDENDPNYPAVVANIASYRQDLERRYPPLCEECRPRVEEELKKHSDEATAEIRASMIASNVSSASNSPKKDVSGKGKARKPLSKIEIQVWRVRAFFWVLGLVLSAARCIRVLVHPSDTPHGESAAREATITLCSIVWTTWNPRWLLYRQYQQAGVPVKMAGLQTWTFFQIIIYLFRILLSTSYLYKLDFLSDQQYSTYRALAALSLTADALLNLIAFNAISIKKIPTAKRQTTVPPLPPAPPRQTFYESALDNLRISEPPPTYTPTKTRTTAWQKSLSPSLLATTPPNGRASSVQPPMPPSPALSPARSISTPPLAGSSVATDPDEPPYPGILMDTRMDTPMDLDPSPAQRQTKTQHPSAEDNFAPQTFPPRFSTTGLEDLMRGFMVTDSTPGTPPRGVGLDAGAGAGAVGRHGWQETGIVELLEGVVLCVGWATQQMRVIQVAWAGIAAVSIYRLGQRHSVASMITTVVALARAAAPLPLLAEWLKTSPRFEALLWDVVCIGVIVTARFSVSRKY